MNISVTKTDLKIIAPQPLIYAFKDISVDFIATPRVGTSPLIVDFVATVIFQGKSVGKYTVQTYRWYFDYDNNPTVYEDVSTTTISHVYDGYYGQKYSVKLEIILNN
jgi:hypothetical protein